MAAAIRRIPLPLNDDSMPVLGQGTLGMGVDPDRRDEEVSALQLGLDLGMTLIDTSEDYGDGAAEEVVSDAIYGRRDQVFLVSKVRPSRATPNDMVVACEQSLRRLGTDYLDVYLLHGRGFELLDEVLEGIARLIDREMITYWGVSHFTALDLQELLLAPARGAPHVAVDQARYNLAHRAVEEDLLPLCRSRGMPLMACSPVAQGKLIAHPAVRHVADHHRARPAQVALAWLLGREGVCVIPRAATPAHVEENRAALDLRLTSEDLLELERAFPPPERPGLDAR
jgi:diketogulonate reductase-like aldo/keto reductase